MRCLALRTVRCITAEFKVQVRDFFDAHLR